MEKLLLLGFILSSLVGGLECDQLCLACSKEDSAYCKACKPNAVMQSNHTCSCIPNASFNPEKDKCECDL